MSHELEIKDGKASMMYVGETPWHTLGNKLNNPPTTAEAIKASGLDWEVGLRTQYNFPDGSPSVEQEISMLSGKPTGRFVLAVKSLPLKSETQTVYRKSDGKILGEVGPKWHPLQNAEAFKWFDPILEAKQATLETAGSLFDGKRIWIQARINREDCRIVGDDLVRKYIMLSNSHDGTLAVKVGYTPQRIVCWNTLSMATNNKASALLKIKHHKSVVETMEKVREIMNIADATFEATAEQYRFLTTKQIDSKSLQKYVDLVFKKEEDENDLVSDEKTKKRELKEDDERLMINKIRPLFEDGIGMNMKGVKGTLWGAYNSVTQFLTWERGRTQDARLDSLWFGTSATQNRKALMVALQMAKAQ